MLEAGRGIASISRNGIGSYTVTLDTAIADANYTVNANSNKAQNFFTAYTTTSFIWNTATAASGINEDATSGTVMVTPFPAA